MSEYYVLDDILRMVADRPDLSMSKFYHQVSKGNIRKHPDDEGKKRGIRYSAESVNKFLRGEFSSDGRGARKQRQSTMIAPQVQPYTVDIAYEDDIALIFLLERRLEQVEQQKALNPFLLESWLKKNKSLYWISCDPENRTKLLAVLGILPLEESLIQRLLIGEITPNDITSDDILVYEPHKKYSCYIVSAVTDDTGRKGSLILPLMRRVFSTWADNSIQVERIYVTQPYMSSQSVGFYDTAIGRIVSEHFFSPIREEESRTVWRLNLERNNNPSPVVQEYQKSIQRQKGNENMHAILGEVAPSMQLGEQRGPNRLQRRYRPNEQGDLAPGVRFRPAVTYEDVLAVIQINNGLFGKSKNVSDDEFVRHRLSWLEQNPEVIHVLEVQKKVIGFVSMLPLPPAAMDDVLQSKIKMSGIEAKDIQRYQPGKPYDVFVWTVGIDQAIQGQRKKLYGTYLVMGMLQSFNSWGERGIQIRTVFARSDEAEGINISHELGMHPVPPPPGVKKAVFEIHPMDEKEQPFLTQYQRNLSRYNEKHAIGTDLRLMTQK